MGLQLADPDYASSGHINIIIGADNYGSVILPGLVRGDPSSPIAQETIFGWILSGPISNTSLSSPAQAYHSTPDNVLHELIARFWKQEELSTTTSTLSPDEEECERHFLSTHSRNESGRYVVRLPLRSDPSLLGDSYTKAFSCLKSLFRRFPSKPEFQELYVNFLKEYMDMGHMVPVENFSQCTTPVFYLPHHGVLREQSRTTKLRVVFNGSSRTNKGHSLNDILHAGAKLQADIFDVILWSRSHRILFSTDIVKMFRQILIHKDDWDLQRILWQGQNGEPAAYKLTTVTYGLNCAPFLALRTIQQLVKDEGNRFPKAIDPLTKGRYVDDIFGGADSIAEAKDIIQQVIQLCEAGCFPLQKWSSNYPEILPDNDHGPPLTIEIEPTLQKILGLIWKPQSDTFHFSTTDNSFNNLTKRTLASEIAKLYDPLGLISPILIKAKILLQELWMQKIEWDDVLPPELQQRWSTFKKQLKNLERVSIPRWLGNIRTNNMTEIHGFSDASQLAMSAVVYVKVPNDNGSFLVQLACSKTKVAPIKRLTIPRLELSAACLLVRLITLAVKALELDNAAIYCWTDSSVTLTWITAHPSRWKEYVRNRVTMIHEILPSASWRFVSGKENPADCASRGLTTEQLIQHDLWWKGPSWLSEPQQLWPMTKLKLTSEIDLEERPGNTMTTTIPSPTYWDMLDKYSSLTKLLRVTATCYRFLACLKKSSQTSLSQQPLTPKEIQQSHIFWVRVVQQAWFPHEIQTLKRREQLPKSNPLVRLIPFLDENGLLRVGGRLHNAPISLDSKHPLILPRKSPLSTLIIDEAHRRMLHGGTQVTLNFLRQTYWIIGGRAPVRSHILKCVRCARYRGLRAKQLMGQLPTTRVTPARPFTNSGLDYAGPVTLKTWRGRAARTYKGYLAIFICLVTSAIHIEVVTDYTTEAFIAAYKRFTGRRGICATLQSDCGTNFVGAEAELRRLFESSSKELQDLATLLANDGTEWKFNPPSAPHLGGKWEAAVKSLKFHLHRVLKDTVLTYEEMTTVTVQIEAVLNSRPLCPLSDDPDDCSALTPGHFLIGDALTTLPEPDLTTVPMNKLTRWQLLKLKVDQFWSKWSSECLQRYQAISKWHHPSNEIKENSVVLIIDERYPPGKWPLARVTKLHPGPDGLTRVVSLKTTATTLKRPITKICVLPINPEAENG